MNVPLSLSILFIVYSIKLFYFTHMYIGRDSTTGAQNDRVSDSQSKSFGRFNNYSGEDNPYSYPQPTPTTPTGPITGGQTIVLSQHHLTPYENTGEGDLSDGDDVGELVQPEFRVGESDECKCAYEC